jgi:replicative DNA helicase
MPIRRFIVPCKAWPLKVCQLIGLPFVEELKFREELDLVGGPYYATKLTNAVVSSANIDAHSRIVLQKFIQRELIRISGEIIHWRCL